MRSKVYQKLAATVLIYVFNIVLVNCADIVSAVQSFAPSTSLSLDAHPDAQKQEKSHRHSVNQLEPDLASSIFDTPAPRKPANSEVIVVANPNNKNPLERTTTMPNTHHIDAGSAVPRGRRAAKSAVKFSEYDHLNADFDMDAQETIVQKEETVLPSNNTAQPKAQILSNSDVSEAIALEADHEESIDFGAIYKAADSQIAFQKAQDTQKQLLAKLDKGTFNFSSSSSSSTPSPENTSIVSVGTITSQPDLNKNIPSFIKHTQLLETTIGSSFLDDSTATILLPKATNKLNFDKSSSTSTTTVSSIGSLPEIHNIATDPIEAEPLVVDDAAMVATTSPLDRSVQKRRSLVSNFVRPVVPPQVWRRLSTRVKRADIRRAVHRRDSSTSSVPQTSTPTPTNTTSPATAITKSRIQYRIKESGERQVVDRSHLQIGLKLVPSTVSPPTTAAIIKKKVSDPQSRTVSGADNFLKDLPATSNSTKDGADVLVSTDGGSDKDLGLQRVGSPAAYDPNLVIRQPELAAQGPPPLQLNHYYIGRRKFVVKSVPVEWWQQQQQQLANVQYQQAFLRQQALQQQQQQLSVAQQPQQFLPPLISILRLGSVPSVQNGKGVDADINPHIQTIAPNQTQIASSSPQERVKTEQLNVVRIFDGQSTTKQVTADIISTSTTPMFRNAFTDVREEIAATPLPAIITTPKPETNEHVQVTDGELYDEVGASEPKRATIMVGDMKRTRRFSAVPLPDSSEENSPLRLVKLPKDSSRRRDQPAGDFGPNRESPHSKPANQAFILSEETLA